MSKEESLESRRTVSLQLCLLAGSGLLLALGVALWRTGGVGVSPLSARVRGLFLKHTRTGNPLVDSVAEHAKPPAGAW